MSLAFAKIRYVAWLIVCWNVVPTQCSGETASSPPDEAAASDSGKSSPTAVLSWPWVPLVEPAVPTVQNSVWVRNPIDAFILADLEAHGLQPTEPASHHSLLRRIFFTLVGLPPTPEQMASFLSNPSDDAYAACVETLLADEGYGERWGRHWLDLVRYSDTAGGAIDYPRPHMWRYRDYVVRAFNQDRPYDRFIREQLAGDTYGSYGDEGRLGLAFLHQWTPVEQTEPELLRRDYLNDVVGVTGSVFLGMTVACARCHDHKYDPIPTRDYYRLEAFFAPTTVHLENVTFGQYEFPNQSPAAWENQKSDWHKLIDDRKKWQDETLEGFRNRLRERAQLTSAGDIKDSIIDAGARLGRAMDDELIFTAEEHDVFNRINRQRALFANPNTRDYYEPKAYVVEDSPLASNVVTHVLSGGSYELPEEAVAPGFLSGVLGHDRPVDLKGQPSPPRKLLAEWIASKDNPLTPRVMVNRIWQHHFGVGLVNTASDFGANGSGVTHQKLIDWLAVQFVESGFSIKDMHRIILDSNVYRQSMTHPRASEFDTIDPKNEFHWVRNAIRLDAEVIRDNLLAVSGQLNRQIGGPPFFPVVNDDLMRRAQTWWEPSPPEQRNRRSIYMLQERTLQHPLIKVFDGANQDESCPVRETTTVAPQVFALFNNEFVHEQSAAMANRIRTEVGDEPSLQVDRAFQLAFQRAPTDDEKSQCVSFLATETATFPQDPVPHGSLANLCLVLLNSNEFIFLE